MLKIVYLGGEIHLDLGDGVLFLSAAGQVVRRL
jgi:hypothetical protein